MSNIKINKITVIYKHIGKEQTVALNEFSDDFEDGKIHVILGENGSGKTTLLRVLLGLEQFNGSIILDDENLNTIPIYKRNFSYVNQSLSIYPHLNVFSNIAYPLKSMHASSDEIRRRVFEIAKNLEIEKLLFRKPRELSYGQNQRVAIAKAMVRKPKCYFFDEPYSNLDENTKKNVINFTRDLFKEQNATLLFVTHNVNEATLLADKIHIIEKGKLIFSGTPKEFVNTKNEEIKKYLLS